MADRPQLNSYNPAEPFIKAKLEGHFIDRLLNAMVETGVPTARALKYFHDEPEGNAGHFLSLLLDDFIPFKYTAQHDGDWKDYAKEAIMLAMPTRANKSIERRTYYPQDTRKRPIELSERAIEIDPEISDAQHSINELMEHDDSYYGGPSIIDYEQMPFDLYGSEIIDLPEAKRYVNEEMGWAGEGYNDYLNELIEINPEYDWAQHTLDPADAANYQTAADKFRNAINQADYNDIIIGNGGINAKSAFQLAQAIENGRIRPTRNQLERLWQGQSLKDFLKDYIERNDYSITQQDLNNIIDTYKPEEILSAYPDIKNLYKEMESVKANADPKAWPEITNSYRELLRNLMNTEGLP